MPTPTHRDPILNPPWCGPSPKVPGYGKLWAEQGAVLFDHRGARVGYATVLYFDSERLHHFETHRGHIAEGAVIDAHGRDWVVTWAEQAEQVAA